MIDTFTVIFNSGGQGIPVLLCHGNPEWSFIYRNIIKEMSDECRLIAYDLPGYGFSELPEDFDYTPEEYVEWINALVYDHLKLDKYIIVVQDWGGSTGLTVAVNNPDDIYAAVISNTWAWEPDSRLALFSNIMKTPIAKRLVLNRNVFAQSVTTTSGNSTSANVEAISDAFANPFPDAQARLVTSIMPMRITQSDHMLSDLESKLDFLSDRPIEFIFGTEDFLLGTQDVMDKWQSYYPNGNVQIVPEANHFTQEDSPESFAIALRRILSDIDEHGMD